MAVPGPPVAGDQRHLAEVLARQIKYATSLSLHGGDAEDAELSAAVLGNLAPHTPIVTVPVVTDRRRPGPEPDHRRPRPAPGLHRTRHRARPHLRPPY
ncbi:hypothetical protein [Nonomuraea sp. NPDC049400]|uniref:hypothetical protein n=1 Tax=Nonomuraea sp. NPDC049400 TaxID=3364352 RepID=UPI003795EA7F